MKISNEEFIKFFNKKDKNKKMEEDIRTMKSSDKLNKEKAKKNNDKINKTTEL